MSRKALQNILAETQLLREMPQWMKAGQALHLQALPDALEPVRSQEQQTGQPSPGELRTVHAGREQSRVQ
ncbi:MAG: hypothetical protein ACRD4A_04730 [Candidatus Acidiferrales bacterium]